MWDLLTSRVRITRHTAYLLETTAIGATVSLTYAPARESGLEFRVASLGPCTGTVHVLGTDAAGITRSDALAFSGAGYRNTLARYASIASITTSGLANEFPVPEVAVRAISGSGGPEGFDYTIREDWPAAIGPTLPAWPNAAGVGTGDTGLAGLILAYDGYFTPREGDIVHDDVGQRWEIVGAPQLASAQMASHWRCRVRRREVDA